MSDNNVEKISEAIIVFDQSKVLPGLKPYNNRPYSELVVGSKYHAKVWRFILKLCTRIV